MIAEDFVTFAVGWWARLFNNPLRIVHSSYRHEDRLEEMAAQSGGQERMERLRACRASVHPQNTAEDLTAMLTQRALKQPPVTPEQIAAFRVTFANEIRGETPTERSPLYIRCDYEPLEHLDRALRAAGIDPTPLGVSVFPTKTVMLIGPTRISVKTGYGEPVRDAWPVLVQSAPIRWGDEDE